MKMAYVASAAKQRRRQYQQRMAASITAAMAKNGISGESVSVTAIGVAAKQLNIGIALQRQCSADDPLLSTTT